MFAKCPNCGFENQLSDSFVEKGYRPEILCCDSEDGGCDEYFAISVKEAVEDFGMVKNKKTTIAVFKLEKV